MPCAEGSYSVTGSSDSGTRGRAVGRSPLAGDVSGGDDLVSDLLPFWRDWAPEEAWDTEPGRRPRFLTSRLYRQVYPYSGDQLGQLMFETGHLHVTTYLSIAHMD